MSHGVIIESRQPECCFEVLRNKPIFWCVLCHLPWRYTNLQATIGCLPKFWKLFKDHRSWYNLLDNLWHPLRGLAQIFTCRHAGGPIFPSCLWGLWFYIFCSLFGQIVIWPPGAFLLSICMHIFIHFLRAVKHLAGFLSSFTVAPILTS